MFYPVRGEMKWFVNERPVVCEKEDYEKDGVIFLIEDGQIVGMGKETDDADRK